MHGLARPIGNRLTPHSSGEVRPQISELARVHRSHGPDREQREQADQEPGKEIILLLTDRSRTAPMNQRKAMPARPQHRPVRPVAEQAPPPHQSTSTDANFCAWGGDDTGAARRRRRPGPRTGSADRVAAHRVVRGDPVDGTRRRRGPRRDHPVGPSCPVDASRSGAHVAARSILELQGPQGWVPLSGGLGHLAH
jgi:hypothetical protein